MKKFMDEDFLLNTDTAKKLYHEYAAKMPIIDYHCHINPKEIAEDKHFNNITEVWLSGDHYKWRFMRTCGAEEKFVTGDATDYEKFEKWAECLTKAIGNPLMHWSHLELQRYFKCDKVLNRNTAKEIYELCNKELTKPETSARKLIMDSNVKVICTTDDPIDSLEYHKMIADDENFSVMVLPSFRPDRCINIESDDFAEYVCELSNVSGVKINNLDDLKQALVKRLDFFCEMGCRVTDHGLPYVMYVPASENEVAEIFEKGLRGQAVTEDEALQYKTAVLLFLHEEYSKRNLVSQLHFGVRRNGNTKMFNSIGRDTGYDCIGGQVNIDELTDFLNALAFKDALPKTIIYSLNPNDNAAIGTIIGSFQDGGFAGKIQHGAAWWFNDHKPGMTEQMWSLASLSNLSGFVGMLTDSRSFLSYTRHEYFRRILCSMIGDMVENGEFPNDEAILKEIVEDICFNNANKYFGFNV